MLFPWLKFLFRHPFRIQYSVYMKLHPFESVFCKSYDFFQTDSKRNVHDNSSIRSLYWKIKSFDFFSDNLNLQTAYVQDKFLIWGFGGHFFWSQRQYIVSECFPFRAVHYLPVGHWIIVFYRKSALYFLKKSQTAIINTATVLTLKITFTLSLYADMSEEVQFPDWIHIQ